MEWELIFYISSTFPGEDKDASSEARPIDEFIEKFNEFVRVSLVGCQNTSNKLVPFLYITQVWNCEVTIITGVSGNGVNDISGFKDS